MRKRELIENPESEFLYLLIYNNKDYKLIYKYITIYLIDILFKGGRINAKAQK